MSDTRPKAGLKHGLIEAGKAIAAALGVIAVLTILGWLGGCSTWASHYPPEVRLFAAVEMGEKVVGDNPTGNILITQPLPGFQELSFQHISSIPNYYDRAEVNQVGWGFCVRVPLRRCTP